MPTVSVLMAVHNGERFLEASVASLLGQSFADFELLLVDDGSVDRTSKLLLELAEQDARIRPFRREHRGLTASLVFAARADGLR